MDFLETFCGHIKRYNTVIIYGYADIGQCVLDYIIEFETSIKIANYSGRVKYFAHSYEEITRVEKKGIKIKSIYNLKNHKKDALVIIAVQEKNQKAVTEILDELGFEHRLYISHENYCRIRMDVENHKNLLDTRVMQYHLNHSRKLERLRDRVKAGKKVKVFFMTHDSAVFGYASVYREMEKQALFEPYIYVVSRRDLGYKEFYEEVKQNVKFFEEKGYRVICGYDEHGIPRDLHQLCPDILFYDSPKLYGACGPSYYRLDHLNWEFLTCYVPYSLLMVDSFYYHYHTMAIRETWRFFADTRASYKRVLADAEFNGYNTVFTGYPKLDDYKEIVKRENDEGRRKKVIYAPHHSLGVSNNLATFDLYKDKFLALVKKYPEIDFVLKPHPLLQYQIRTRHEAGAISFSREDYWQYVEEWRSLPNGFFVDSGEYISMFMDSDCMITDCGSFIGEYFPSSHPCIYLFNPRKKNQEDIYTPLAKDILNTYYVANCWNELEKEFEETVIREHDWKLEKRKELYRKEFGDMGEAGKKICQHIVEQIRE